MGKHAGQPSEEPEYAPFYRQPKYARPPSWDRPDDTRKMAPIPPEVQASLAKASPYYRSRPRRIAGRLGTALLFVFLVLAGLALAWTLLGIIAVAIVGHR